MKNTTKPIEEIFLESLLKLCLVSILVVTIADFYITGFEVIRSAIIDLSILFAVVVALILYKLGHFTSSVLLISFVTMAAMFYQSIEADSITTSSMAVVMVIGFGFSVLLKGKVPLILHAITLAGIMLVFSWLILHPIRYGKPNSNDIIVASVTYAVLYIIIAYSSWLLKQRYDDALKNLASMNDELIEKSNEIETQNEELIQSQENLFQLNNHLETIVQERTQKVNRQNEQLISYAYSNAHYVRGPVARVLGLIQLTKMQTDLDYPELFKKIEEQTKEIDEVVKRINKELEK